MQSVCMGSPAIVRLCHYIVYFNHFNNHNHIGVATQRAGELQPPVKDRDTLIEQSVTRINKTHRIIVKQVVYDKFMKQIRAVRHSFNTANYRVQLAVPPSIHIHSTVVILPFNSLTKSTSKAKSINRTSSTGWCPFL